MIPNPVLAVARRTAESTLDSTCSIGYRINTPDNYGSYTKVFASRIIRPCRVDTAGSETVTPDVQVHYTHLVRLPWNTDCAETDVIRIGDREFEVVATNSLKTFRLLLTVNCVEVKLP